MNRIQKMSQDILAKRLKLQLGIALEADIDLFTLQAMNRQLQNERALKMENAEASCLSQGKRRAA